MEINGKRKVEEPVADTFSGELQNAAKRRKQTTDDEKNRESTRKRVSKWRSSQSDQSRDNIRSRDRIRKATEKALQGNAVNSSGIARNQEFLRNAAYNYGADVEYHKLPSVQIGAMNIKCFHCHALRFPGEPAGLCCSKGQVKLPSQEPPPEPLRSLIDGLHPESRHFLSNIRKYNCCFQMTSFGATREVREHGFMPTFKVQGQVYHLAGSLLPAENANPQYLQIYFVGDSRDEANSRCLNIPDIKQSIVMPLQELLHEHNRYVNIFQTALERMPSDSYQVIIRPDKTPAGEHVRRFNAPTIDEVAIVMVGNDFNPRDIVLHKKSSQLTRVIETHRSYDALQYPLIFWKGEDGYNFGIPKINPVSGELQAKKVSAMDFYAYRIMVRDEDENIILKFRQLFHQYVVDMYAKIESERLLYIRLNQKKLRVDDYAHLKDAMVNDARPGDLGKMVILPSSFQGGPRHMHEYTQDALTYVRRYGRPDLFITFTCNPLWQEIKDLLFSGQSPSDRHDLIARVFKQKLSVLLKLITKSHVFGEVNAWMYSIEWQKRGLPHSHMLVWLKNHIHGNDMDKVISAEIPDKESDPALHEVVTTQMIHGPCGTLNPNSPCMINGKCSKDYPKQFLAETMSGNDGYPQYRRRKPEDGGFCTTMRMKVGNGFHEMKIDNRWVVPYSPLLSKIFHAHINVESCHSVKAIKYMCKYVNKGSDQAVFEVSNSSDEVKEFLMGRYISSNEAVWRILGFALHERSPAVVHLSVHLENGQRVYFTEHNLQGKLQTPPATTLIGFFDLCRQDPFARTLLYCDVPTYYTWNAVSKTFQRRKQGKSIDGHLDVKASHALGRVYTVHPANAECFYLRMLLHVVRGPTSFADLKTVDGQECETYREACLKRGLLEDDRHWEETLREACTTQSATRLRQLYCILLTTCSLANPLYLWEMFQEEMSADILHSLRRQHSELNVHISPNVQNQALILLDDLCLTMTGKHINQYGLPSPIRDQSNPLCTEILREKSYDCVQLEAFVAENEPLLEANQKAAYEEVLRRVESQDGVILFLDAPGGTGKTYVINLLLAKLRSQSNIALAVASSGIAATLLDGGRTAHSAFKLPLQLAHCDTVPTCNIVKGSGLAKLLQECKLIVWDECTMAHKHALEALDLTLRDLRSNDHVMGGIVVLLAGDFRQILPVIPKSTPADELNACLKASHLWRNVRKLALTKNMRVHLLGDESAGHFSEQLLALGDGKIAADSSNGQISFPSNFCCMVGSQYALQSKVFPDIQLNFRNTQWLCERVILASKNDSVFRINKWLLDQLPGEVKSYKAIDTVDDPTEAVHYPTEFLNSLQPSGVPPYNLELKIGAPIMLLRNLQPPKLCNGTRLVIKNLFAHIIEATITTGHGKGEDVYIPRIPLLPSDMPFSFRRLQFPISLAFSMSINKSQGQTLKVVGIDLEEPCFAHGQLYVACSRVGNPKNLFVYAPGAKTANIVYKKALT